jgi:hypothetical protein
MRKWQRWTSEHKEAQNDDESVTSEENTLTIRRFKRKLQEN